MAPTYLSPKVTRKLNQFSKTPRGFVSGHGFPGKILGPRGFTLRMEPGGSPSSHIERTMPPTKDDKCEKRRYTRKKRHAWGKELPNAAQSQSTFANIASRGGDGRETVIPPLPTEVGIDFHRRLRTTKVRSPSSRRWSSGTVPEFTNNSEATLPFSFSFLRVEYYAGPR